MPNTKNHEKIWTLGSVTNQADLRKWKGGKILLLEKKDNKNDFQEIAPET